MKILISYWYEINTHHVLPTNGKTSWFPDWFSMSTSPVTQKCKPQQPQSLGGLRDHRITSQTCITKHQDWNPWSSVKLSCFGCLLTRSRCVQRAELQASVTPLSCSVDTANPTGSVTTGPRTFFLLPFPPSPHSRDALQAAQAPFPQAHTPSFTTKTLKSRWSTNSMLCHVTPCNRSEDFTWPFRASP